MPDQTVNKRRLGRESLVNLSTARARYAITFSVATDSSVVWKSILSAATPLTAVRVAAESIEKSTLANVLRPCLPTFGPPRPTAVPFESSCATRHAASQFSKLERLSGVAARWTRGKLRAHLQLQITRSHLEDAVHLNDDAVAGSIRQAHLARLAKDLHLYTSRPRAPRPLIARSRLGGVVSAAGAAAGVAVAVAVAIAIAVAIALPLRDRLVRSQEEQEEQRARFHRRVGARQHPRLQSRHSGIIKGGAIKKGISIR